jgi:hypothetical protein
MGKILGISLKSAGIVMAGLTVALVAAPATAEAAASSGSGPVITSSTLPVSGIAAMAADTKHGHLFVAGGYSDFSLSVTDFSGKVVGTIPLGSRASSLALTSDERTLFVALPDAASIAVINTATLTETASYSTGAGTAPTYVAAVGHDAWFGYGQPANAGIGFLDPRHGTVTLTPESAFYAAPKVLTSPAAPGIVLAGEVSVSPSVLEEFDIASGSPVLKAATQVGTTDGCEFLKDFAFTPDGRDVVTACGWPYYAVSYRLQGLVQDGTYQTGPYTNRVAISDRGRIAVGLNPSGPANLDLFSPGDATPTASLALGGPSVGNETVTGLAWVSCGRELLATVYDQLTSSVILYTIDFGAR